MPRRPVRSLVSSFCYGAVVAIVLLRLFSGCALKAGHEAGGDLQAAGVASIRNDIDAVAGDLATVKQSLQVQIEASATATVAAVLDQSARITETTQRAVVALNKTDNSTSDKWVNRLIAGALVVVALAYPVGKLIWMVAAAGGRRVTGKACRV